MADTPSSFSGSLGGGAAGDFDCGAANPPSQQHQQPFRHVPVYSQLQEESQAADSIARICQLFLGDDFYREQLVELMADPEEHKHFGVNIK
jgi:hypothetical protein